MAKHIFITGGVVSSLGKGLTSASIGLLLESRGLKVNIQKFDPYINVDPGTMSPYQHGEVFVTDDGAETDLDLGHYERFTNAHLTRDCSVTTGQVYGEVIRRERHGDFLGKTVQVVPHITDEIKSRIKKLATKGIDVVISEIGGTVGDIEGLPFLEAIRQFALGEGRENVMFIHLTLIPCLRATGEIKTKPTQHSVGKLREIGIQPDILICRTEKHLSKDVRQKISLFCSVPMDCVVEEMDAEFSIYEVPVMLAREKVDALVIKRLGLKADGKDLERWKKLLNVLRKPPKTVEVALVGKYVELYDSYKSVYEALTHGGLAHRAKVIVRRVHAESLATMRDVRKALKGVAGIVVPGGFGHRGIEGKVLAIRHAREKKIPYLGLCLGLQVACAEFARNVCGMKNANSTEFDKDTPYPVITLMDEQGNVVDMGGTMRLGAYPCVLKKGSRAHKAYRSLDIAERHRHRYEFNNKYKEVFERNGMVFSGMSPDGKLVELIELKNHPWFVGTQAHPEFKSKPTRPHPLFAGFIKHALKYARAREK